MALAPLPAAVKGDDRAASAFLLADEGSQLILGAQVVMEDDLGPVATKLAEVFRGGGTDGRRGLPAEISFTSPRLHAALSPALAALGVGTYIVEQPAFLAEAIGSLRATLCGEDSLGREPATLDEWKEVDRRLTARLHETAATEGFLGAGAVALYFGSRKIGEQVLSELSSLSPMGAFLEWLVCDYRPRPRSKTCVEKLLAYPDLGPAERTLLEARRTAELSVYRVDACHPGVSLEVEDILSGKRQVLTDSAMSGCGLEGYFLTLRLLRVGEWVFPCFGGPPMSTAHVDRFLEELEDLGVDLTKDGLRRNADKVGWMWGWALEAKRAAPKLTNTDGDPLELQTAVFQVPDAAALASDLGSREHVEAAPDGTWTWLRAGGPAPGVGETTVLAHLELHDDRLVVEVNSSNRLARARTWLERIPGVRFESARSVELEHRSLDDRLPSKPPQPLSPAMRNEATRQFHKVCRAGLDERVPALGNKTPRAASKTAAGRLRVARMIRSMPTMQAPGCSIAPPREEMLRELGIQK